MIVSNDSFGDTPDNCLNPGCAVQNSAQYGPADGGLSSDPDKKVKAILSSRTLIYEILWLRV